ncbi:unnamed protein product [Porites evermanni]|uniref:Uncharacterized protein n=1 Tax=Porites evermanni TaxID=104178 RepID=A0ABN8QSN9_9CNID|nr:unnamed protein product [Porites evermanni]
MNAGVFALILALFALAPVQGVKKCEKIDTCRCLTDEGEISLWSLAGQTPPNRARFNISSSSSSSTFYQWNPCSAWTAQGHPCEDAAVCQVTRPSNSRQSSYVNIGEREMSDCVLDEQRGQCQLTYGVKGSNKITTIALVCSATEEGRVDPMVSDSSSFKTSLHSVCACPGKCSLGVKGNAGIQYESSSDDKGGLSIGAIVGIAIAGVIFLILVAFGILICCLRRKLPSGVPKPSICTTIKVNHLQ